MATASLKPCVPFTSTEILAETDIKRHLSALLLWMTPKDDDQVEARVKLETISGGTTNTIYRLTNAENGDSVVVRIFGAEQVFDDEARRKETRIFEQLSQAGIAPRLRATFPNGRVEQYIPASPIRVEHMRDADVCIGVASNLARLHKFRPTMEQTPPECPPIWSIIEQWIDLSSKLLANSRPFKSARVLRAYVKRVAAILPLLRRQLENGDVVFAHNDVHAANILRSPNGSITIVDFEYSGWNYRCYDIANFFSEAMIDLQTVYVNRLHYPNMYWRTRFCTEYLREFHDCGHALPDKEMVNDLVHGVERYTNLSHIYWGLWAIVQSFSATGSFPYAEYARQRLDIFFDNSKAL